MSVFNHILIGYLFGDNKDKTSRARSQEVERILDFVGLSGMSDRRAADLTLADQKRLEVARALATQPELLLLDEVMAGLNPTEVSEAMELVRKIREKGITVIMIEHVMKAIMAICDRVIVLHHGEKLAEGKPEEITRNKSVIEVYLGDFTCLPSET
jgi:branched-chain amino acid transport system ATP-binding protein